MANNHTSPIENTLVYHCERLKKLILASSAQRGLISGKMAKRTMVHPSQGVRHRAEGCVVLGWNLASDVNDPIGAPSSASLYSRLPAVWIGASTLTSGQKWIPRKRNWLSKTLKNKGTHFQRDLYKKFVSGREARALEHHQGALVQPEHAVEVSAKAKDELAARNLTELISETALSGVSSSDIRLQEGSSSSIPAESGEKHLSLKNRQASIRWAEAEKSTEGSKPENTGTPKLAETSTATSKRPRPEGGTSVEWVRPPERSRDSSGPEAHEEALTNLQDKPS
jgi:hypothetical protein